MRIPLANLLVKSPLPKVEEAMTAVLRCSEEVPALIDALIAGDQVLVEQLAKKISVLEGEADTVKNRVRSNMPLRLFLPVDRRDLLRLISEVDAIADCAEDLGVLLTIRPLEVPEEMKTLLGLLTERVMDCVVSSAELVGSLGTLLESSFGGQAAERALAQADEVGRKEHEADKLQDQCAKVLFQSEDQMSPIAVMMWTKVLNKLGDLANHAENVGDVFRLFVAR